MATLAQKLLLLPLFSSEKYRTSLRPRGQQIHAKPHHGAKNVYKSAPRANLQGITPALSCQTLPGVACSLVAIPRYFGGVCFLQLWPQQFKRWITLVHQLRSVLSSGQYYPPFEQQMPDPRDEEGISLLEILKKATNRKSSERVHIVYFKESAAYGVIFTSCLSQNPNE